MKSLKGVTVTTTLHSRELQAAFGNIVALSTLK